MPKLSQTRNSTSFRQSALPSRKKLISGHAISTTTFEKALSFSTKKTEQNVGMAVSVSGTCRHLFATFLARITITINSVVCLVCTRLLGISYDAYTWENHLFHFEDSTTTDFRSTGYVEDFTVEDANRLNLNTRSSSSSSASSSSREALFQPVSTSLSKSGPVWICRLVKLSLESAHVSQN